MTVKRIFCCAASLAIAAFFALAPSAKANSVDGTLTLTGCPGSGCPNATYTFTITNTSATLTIDITGSVNSNDDKIDAVDLGFVPSHDISGLSSTGPSGTWTGVTGPVNSSGGGCKANTGAFVCASGLISISKGNSYSWTWDFDSLSNSIIDGIIGSNTVHIGVQYGPGQNGNFKGEIVSQTANAVGGTTPTPTPEPSTLVLLGTGLLGLGAGLRRHLNA